MPTRLICVLLLMLSATILFLAGCGGGGSTGQTQSTTVALQSQVKTGAATIVFQTYSSPGDFQGSTSPAGMDFTLKSVINSNAGSMASDVAITSEDISFEYLSSAPQISVVPAIIPTLTYYSNLLVPAGGTNDWSNVPIFDDRQRKYLFDNVVANSYVGQLRYNMRITFNGYEVKNGSKVSVSTSATLYVDKLR